MTTKQRLDLLDRSVEKTHIWVNDVAEGLGEQDRAAALRALRAVLHTLRDRLTVEEGAQLAAQFPVVIRGLFYESWRPAHLPEGYGAAREFLDRVARDAGLAGDTEAEYAVRAVAGTLRRHVSAGELDDVLHVLPHQIRDLFTDVGAEKK